MRTASALLLLVAATSSVAHAVDAGDAEARPSEEAGVYSRTGGWVGAGGAFALSSFDRPGFYDNSGVLSLRAGYRGLPHVAVELLGEVLPNFDGDQAPDGDVDGYAVTANGKLYLPLGRVEPWTMAGIGFLDIAPENRHEREDFAFRFAAGLDAYLTRHWAFYLEAAYVLPTGDVSDYRYSQYGAGFLLRF